MKRLVLLTALVASAASAQLSEKPADAIVPVIGSTRGQSSSNFKTELQITNQTGSQMTGWLIFHPQGQSGSITDPVLRYELAAHATVAYADVVAALGTTGLGSLDVFVDRGQIPTIVARAFDDQATGTTGVAVPLVRTSAALGHDDTVALIAPRDLARFRFNIGLRSLANGVTLDLIVRDSAGAERHRKSVTYPATFFDQFPGDVFAGTQLRANDSIEIRIASGSAFIYATTVDNQTNDSSLQLLRK